MDRKVLVQKLINAEHDILQEILRESELKLAAQLQSGLAADQRAFTYLGFIVVIVVVIVGAAFSLQIDKPTNTALSVICLLLSGGFFTSCIYLYKSAKPVDWYFAGNEPNKWLEDIENKITLHHALAAQCGYYDKCLTENNRSLVNASQNFENATLIFVITVAFCGLLSLVVWIDYLPWQFCIPIK